MRRSAVVLLLAAGCGRIGFDGARDGSPDVTPDVYAVGAFSTPVRITALSSPGRDDDVTCTDDLLELYFFSDRPPNGNDIWRSTRASTSDPWGAPTMVPELTTLRGELTPEISGDGLRMYFVSNRTSAMLTDYDVFYTTRPDRTSTWAMPVRVDELSSTDIEYSATEDRSGTTLYLQRNLSTGADIFLSTRATPADRWSAPVPVTAVNGTAHADTDPFPTVLGLYFSSTRTGVFSPYFAPAQGGTFGTPVLVPDLDSPQQEQDIWISPDGHHALFSSDRDGNFEIYEASR